MSKTDKTRYYGPITKDLYEIFKKNCNENRVLVLPKIRPLLNKLNLFPTQSQICELVYASCEMMGRTPVDHITFSEFAFLVTHLSHQYKMKHTNATPQSQMKERAIEILTRKRKARRFSVFLGGSCNPTTWRLDIAIPFLKKHGITFYNPQVNNWRSELMELEDQAKQTAEVLFFVIDNQTRSTASMVEAAYIAGCGQQLILIIKNFKTPVYIYGEKLHERELDDLDRSHAYLTDLVERMSIPVFNDINVALVCLKKVVKQNIKVSQLKLSDGAQPVIFPHIRIAKEFIYVKEAFNTMDSNNSCLLNKSELALAYQAVTNENLNLHNLDGYTKSFSFDDFCLIISEFRFQKKNIFSRLWAFLFNITFLLLNLLFGSKNSLESTIEVNDKQKDVFLGGSCGQSKWREEIAVPILRRHGISYFNPQLEEWDTHYIAREAAIKDKCQVLLYVITNDTRAMTSMIEAGYFIGQGCNIVLCIQNMIEGISIDNEDLTDNAVKDYNRARSYLADLANRDGVPVLDNIEEAVKCVVQKHVEIQEISTHDCNR